MKRRLRKQARKLFWLVDDDYATFRARWPALWDRILRETAVQAGPDA